MAVSARDLQICCSIVKFLQGHIDRHMISEEGVESLEVAISCIQQAYGLDSFEGAANGVPVTLEEAFDRVTAVNGVDGETNREEAERLKNEGNTKLKQNDLPGAIDLYSRAIELDPSNATYYSNRAAAYIKQNELQVAINDCKRAISLNPDYAKAYGRLGMAYNLLNQTEEAITAYEEAVRRDPGNAEYRSSLDQLKSGNDSAQDRPGMGPSPGGSGTGPSPGGPRMGPPGGPGMGPPPGFDMSNISGLMSNPGFMNLASTVMSNPVFQGMATSLLQNQMGAGRGGPRPEGTNPRPFPMTITEMIPQMAEMAQQMQDTDPVGFENLRETAAHFQAQHDDTHPKDDDTTNN